MIAFFWGDFYARFEIRTFLLLLFVGHFHCRLFALSLLLPVCTWRNCKIEQLALACWGRRGPLGPGPWPRWDLIRRKLFPDRECLIDRRSVENLCTSCEGTAGHLGATERVLSHFRGCSFSVEKGLSRGPKAKITRDLYGD